MAVLLAHPSASEERLMGPSPGGPAVGRKLALQGLRAAAMNGARGLCVGLEGDGPSERLLVALEPLPGVGPGAPAKTVKVKRENAAFDPLPGSREPETGADGGSGEAASAASEVHVLQLAGPHAPLLRVRELAIEHPDAPFQVLARHFSRNLLSS